MGSENLCIEVIMFLTF